MTKNEILALCDHTVLRTDASFDEIAENCRLAIEYNCACMCLAPTHVYEAKRIFGKNLKICTVVGFPNGYSDTATKVFETQHLIEEGADEIDVVINIADACAGDYSKVERELMSIRRACENHVLKVIVECCSLSDENLREMCKVVSAVGADYIKTSTGFGKYGARVEDIVLMRLECDPKTKIKAAGGISNFEDAQRLIDAGADRLGTSKLVGIMLKDKT